MDLAILRKVGNIQQLAGIRLSELQDGPGRGMRVAEVWNAAGLRFSVLPDRCMDLYDFSCRGTNCAFYTKNALNRRPLTSRDDFFSGWTGGMLVTCGLSNVGGACDDGGFQPTHGRIGCTPAEQFSCFAGWRGEDYVLELSGLMQETRLYGRSLALRRTIQTSLQSTSVSITDTIENCCERDEEFMLLYHINFGYPLLDTGSRFFSSPLLKTRAFSEESHDFSCMPAPGSAPSDRQFHHTPQDKTAFAGIANPSLGLGMKLSFETDRLPYLSEWIHTQPNDYVMALEPCNCQLLGKAEERKNGTLKVLPAYESITHTITLQMCTSESPCGIPLDLFVP